MKTLKEQQAEAWWLAPDDARWIAQDSNGIFWWYSYQPKVDEYSFRIRINLSTKEGKLCTFKINGWDWRDTLQTREEWEAMNNQGNAEEKAAIMKNEKCMPSTSEWCEVKWRCDDSVEQICPMFISDYTVVFEDKDGEERHVDLKNISLFRPIQTQADKYRDEQIDYMDKILCGAIERDLSMAVELYEEGVRVLAPDEFVAKRLTAGQLRDIRKKNPRYDLPTFTYVANDIQNAILGGGK